jgi:hypothetical protein
VHRSYRPRHPSQVPGWGPAPGWTQPLPGWSPLVDHGPRSLRVASSVARWWWPTLALAAFGAVAGFILGHDHPTPGLSTRGLVTIALAGLVVVLLTLHRSAGPSHLARATAEYAVVALFAALLALAGSFDQPPTNPAGSSATTEAKHSPTGTPKVTAGEDRPGVLRVAAGVTRAVSKAIRAVTGAAGWLVDLWRQADAQADHPSRSHPTTPEGGAMPSSPTPISSTGRPL